MFHRKCRSHFDVESHARLGKSLLVSRGDEMADAHARHGARDAGAWIASEAQARQAGDALATLVHQRTAIAASPAAEAANKDRPAREGPDGGRDGARGRLYAR